MRDLRRLNFAQAAPNCPRDLGGVTDMLFVPGQLDTTYRRRWAERLGITQRLAQAPAV
ncbi:MAG: hypothetical protein KF752_20160 [Pirellulaceae bacterium]|nr:hypothetical protein [Pirellulaceae bacterium]